MLEIPGEEAQTDPGLEQKQKLAAAHIAQERRRRARGRVIGALATALLLGLRGFRCSLKIPRPVPTHWLGYAAGRKAPISSGCCRRRLPKMSYADDNDFYVPFNQNLKKSVRLRARP